MIVQLHTFTKEIITRFGYFFNFSVILSTIFPNSDPTMHFIGNIFIEDCFFTFCKRGGGTILPSEKSYSTLMIFTYSSELDIILDCPAVFGLSARLWLR